ncbi:MAG: patatin-like phospholipase family protein [Flavobacteriia bacterium]|nr:patatin-like phospholipase family protein [Flavobacteriia bacterium]
MSKFIVSFLLLFISHTSFSQKVGLVLSGGGASAFAHIGVLKALEENEIPVDYITGTSAGALIAALYASSYSPIEIQDFVLSEKFQAMAKGELLTKHKYYFLQDNSDASIIEVPFTIDSLILKSLPTNLRSSIMLDFELMMLLGPAGESVNGQFDDLFIPFRAIAGDIVSKEAIVFDKGKLNEVIRAAITYPFYFTPIEIDGKLLFDGGLYNNFPIDVLYHQFDVDFIIGSNVTLNAKKPTDSNIFSQLENMLVRHSNFNLPCEEGVIIHPKVDLNTFEFDEVEKAIQEGYFSTIKMMDSIKKYVTERKSFQELHLSRIKFRKNIKELKINKVLTTNTKNKDIVFIEKSLLKPNRNHLLLIKKLEKRYYRLANFEQISHMYPTLNFVDTAYQLDIKMKRSKKLKLEVGGHFSSRPINTGYIALNYLNIKKKAIKIKAESYFGRFYGSLRAYMNYTLPNYFPITFVPYFTMNRWDYYRSFSTFFEDVKPSFLVQNERYYGVKIKQALGNKGCNFFEYRHFDLKDSYYQSSKFTSKDTADITTFRGNQISWGLEFSSLNKKQFANSGNLFAVKLRYIQGKERSISGSTSLEKYDKIKWHEWVQLNVELQSYFLDFRNIHVGIHAKSVLNSQSLFYNYTASILNTTEFNAIPDLSSFFLPEYRSPQHLGFGLNTVFTANENIDFRIDSYFYQPIKMLVLNPDGSFNYSKNFKGETFLFSLSLIYHSPIGPIRATANYFPKQTLKSITFQNQTYPLSFQISYGYLLFNERAIR